MINTRTVTAIDQDGMVTRTMTFVCRIFDDDKNFDVEKAAKQAATEYMKTPEGQKQLSHNGGSFNWADLPDVPAGITKKHGFEITAVMTESLVVDWNEQLYTVG